MIKELQAIFHEIFCKTALNFQNIVKNIIEPDDNFQGLIQAFPAAKVAAVKPKRLNGPSMCTAMKL